MSIAWEKARRYTYGDYLGWTGDERWELIEGVPRAMTPAPTFSHQRIVIGLARQLHEWFEDKPCEPFVSPVDVRLPEAGESDSQIHTVVQPDLGVVCDPDKIDERGVRGAPDFVIEVLSPGTASHDQITKARLYEHHGVKEYWVVDVVQRLVYIRRRMESGAFGATEFVDAKGKVPVALFPDLEIDMDEAFARVVPPPLD